MYFMVKPLTEGGDFLHFVYGESEIEYLMSKDRVFGEAIEKIGFIERTVDPNIFSSLVRAIVGQQISTKAQRTIFLRIKDGLGDITPDVVNELPEEELQSYGISFRKAGYIKKIAHKITSGQFDIEGLYHLTDDEVCCELSSLDGIGVWTAEMLMIFSMQRQNVLSFGDLGIQRGLRMLYHHRKVDRKLFDKYRRRYSPCGSVASLYLWEISGGRIEGMKDYAPAKKRSKKAK